MSVVLLVSRSVATKVDGLVAHWVLNRVVTKVYSWVVLSAEKRVAAWVAGLVDMTEDGLAAH